VFTDNTQKNKQELFACSKIYAFLNKQREEKAAKSIGITGGLKVLQFEV